MHAILAILVAAAAPEVFARNAQAQLDGEALVFSFELGARAPSRVAVRSVDFTISVEGLPLISSSALGFEIPGAGDRSILIAAYGGAERTLAVLDKLASLEKFEYSVRGVLHLADGDVAFSAT